MNLYSRLLELDETLFQMEQGVDIVWAEAAAAQCMGDNCALGLHGAWVLLSELQDRLRGRLDELLAAQELTTR